MKNSWSITVGEFVDGGYQDWIDNGVYSAYDLRMPDDTEPDEAFETFRKLFEKRKDLEEIKSITRVDFNGVFRYQVALKVGGFIILEDGDEIYLVEN